MTNKTKPVQPKPDQHRPQGVQVDLNANIGHLSNRGGLSENVVRNNHQPPSRPEPGGKKDGNDTK
jgi:hypothetical protein